MSSEHMLLVNKRPDALLGRPNGKKRFEFSELESAQNLL